MKYIAVLSLILVLIPCVSAFDATISSYSTGGSSHIRLETETETANDLIRYGTTTGSYLSNTASTDMTSNGITAYQFSAKTGAKLHNSSLDSESYGSMVAYDTAALQQDQKNAPNTLCDTDGLGVSNYTSNSSEAGKYPQSTSALIKVGMMGSGDGNENTAKYTSDVDQSGTDMEVTHESSGVLGLNFESLQADTIAGHNQSYATAQFSKSVNYHVVDTANQSSGLKAGSIIKFKGPQYSGPNIPVSWETNVTNES